MQVEAAHLCYLVGGVLPQVYEPLARMCLLGADHRTAPHSLASVSALQRTEVLEWVKLPGTVCLTFRWPQRTSTPVYLIMPLHSHVRHCQR